MKTLQITAVALLALLAVPAFGEGPRSVDLPDRMAPDSTAALTPGTRIRVYGRRNLVGTLLGSDVGTLRVLREGGRDTVVVTDRELRRLQVSRGLKQSPGQSAGKGALIGFGIGTAVGALVNGALTDDGSGADKGTSAFFTARNPQGRG